MSQSRGIGAVTTDKTARKWTGIFIPLSTCLDNLKTYLLSVNHTSNSL